MTRTAPLADPRFLEPVRRTLLARRDFRLEQLDQLDRQRSLRARSSAHREIYVSLAVGARAALQDIESALQRIDEGRFGRCVGCAGELDRQVLEALPQTARCLPCQRGALEHDLPRAQPVLTGGRAR